MPCAAFSVGFSRLFQRIAAPRRALQTARYQKNVIFFACPAFCASQTAKAIVYPCPRQHVGIGRRTRLKIGRPKGVWVRVPLLAPSLLMVKNPASSLVFSKGRCGFFCVWIIKARPLRPEPRADPRRRLSDRPNQGSFAASVGEGAILVCLEPPPHPLFVPPMPLDARAQSPAVGRHLWLSSHQSQLVGDA